eukprot:6304243-Amphidinium_carterae.2
MAGTCNSTWVIELILLSRQPVASCFVLNLVVLSVYAWCVSEWSIPVLLVSGLTVTCVRMILSVSCKYSSCDFKHWFLVALLLTCMALVGPVLAASIDAIVCRCASRWMVTAKFLHVYATELYNVLAHTRLRVVDCDNDAGSQVCSSGVQLDARVHITPARRCSRRRFAAARRRPLKIVYNPRSHGQCLWASTA